MSLIAPENVRFIKLKNKEIVIGFVEQHEDFIYLARPIELTFENYEDEDQQILKIKEWLPPLVAKFDYVTIDMKDIFCILEVQEIFLESYLEMAEAFFEVAPAASLKKKALQEHADKSVVSLEDIWNSIKKH